MQFLTFPNTLAVVTAIQLPVLLSHVAGVSISDLLQFSL